MTDQRISVTRQHWRRLQPEIEANFNALWKEPELPNMEFKAEARISGWLQEHGFTVERGACGQPTAFVATYGTDNSPSIGILAEYDALPSLGNAAVPYRKPDGKRAGHACGHNQIGPTNAGAAIAARYAAEELGLKGKITVIGCPAEEIVWGKVALLVAGAFDGLDSILTSHGDYQTGAISRPCQSVFGGEFVFSGESGHGGGVRKRNALDAAELAVQSVERLRAHHFPDTSVEHVLRVGGAIPNVTPDETRLWIFVRHLDYERAEEVYRFVVGVCRKATEMAGTAFREQFISATHGYLPNDTLARAIFRNMEIVGPPQWTDDGLRWMRELAKTCRPEEAFELDRSIDLYTKGTDPYGQDDGEASWRIPLGRANWAIPPQVSLHNWSYTALAGHEASHPGPLMVSESLALTTTELLANPTLVEEAKAELREHLDSGVVPQPQLGAYKTMTKTPERFWDSTWIEGPERHRARTGRN